MIRRDFSESIRIPRLAVRRRGRRRYQIVVWTLKMSGPLYRAEKNRAVQLLRPDPDGAENRSRLLRLGRSAMTTPSHSYWNASRSRRGRPHWWISGQFPAEVAWLPSH